MKLTGPSLVCVFLLACSGSNAARDAGLDAASADSAASEDAAAPDGASMDGGLALDAAAPDGAAGGDWFDVFASMNAALCECGYGPRGYDSAAQCVATEGSVDESVRACGVQAHASHAGALGEGFICQRAAVREAADCYQASRCDVDALNACEAGLNMARRGCAAVPDAAISEFFEGVGACVVGESDACPSPDASVSGLGASVFSGNTAGRGDDFLGSCGSGPAPDVALAYRADLAGRYRFDTHGSSFDTELVVYVDYAATRELACAEDDGERYTSEVELTLDAGQQILLVVDGFDGLAAGAYVVNVTRL